MAQIKVSVIIPVYNVEAYIIECLESVARQTYPGNLECLIVDDCGTDRSIHLANEFINNYHGKIRFQILHHNRNRGLSAARNTGTDAAVGDYIYYLDSDDMITPECIGQMMDVAEKYAEAEVIQGGILNSDGTDNYNIIDKRLPDIATDIKWIKTNVMFPGLLPVSSWNKLIKRDFLNDNSIRFIEGIIHEDVPFAFHLAQRMKCIAFCKNNTYIYRQQRNGSILNSSTRQRSFTSRVKAYQYCLEHTNGIYRDIQLRSLFLRWQYALLTRPDTVEARRLSSMLYRQMLKYSPLTEKLIIISHRILPHRLCSWRIVYSFFERITMPTKGNS